MNWNSVEQKCKAIYLTQLINGKDPLERKMMISLIAEEFPEFPRMRIAFAVDRCINSNQGLMSPNAFLTFVQSYLR
ncbi:MAG: hypothetical protein M0D53_14285 [Flavobacterium sp. JAD_PAG50586_2]|nr:MAG: hypothetical protein M0D53_14285 [Flavobacterium sp. JAD_PAG50586_2]